MIIKLIQRKLAGVEVTNHGIFNIATKRGKTRDEAKRNLLDELGLL